MEGGECLPSTPIPTFVVTGGTTPGKNCRLLSTALRCACLDCIFGIPSNKQLLLSGQKTLKKCPTLMKILRKVALSGRLTSCT